MIRGKFPTILAPVVQDQAQSKFNQELSDGFKRIVPVPFKDLRVEAGDWVAGTNRVPHELGKVPSGYAIIRKSAALDVFETRAATDTAVFLEATSLLVDFTLRIYG